MQAIIQFVGLKIRGQQIATGQAGAGGPVGKISLTLETLAIFLRVLQMQSQSGPPEIAREALQLKHHALTLHPELQVLIVEAAAASSVPTPAAAFPTDIEEEANAYFQKVHPSLFYLVRITSDSMAHHLGPSKFARDAKGQR